MLRFLAFVLAALMAVPAFAADADDAAQEAAEVAIGQAIAARGNGEFGKARKLLHGVLVNDPSHARALHELGVLHAVFGELDAAARTFTAALKADPSLKVTRRNLAEILRAAGRYEEALPHFNRLRDVPESRDVALRGIAVCEEAAGRPEAAIAALDELARGHKNDDMSKWVAQQRAMLKAARQQPGIAVKTAQREADRHFKARRYRHASHWYELACRKGPSADRCYRHAIALLAMRDYLGAIGSLRKALKLEPGHMPSLSAWPTAVRKLRSEGSGALVVDLPTDAGEQPIRRAATALLGGELLLARRICRAAKKGHYGGVVLLLIEAESLLRDGRRSSADKLLRAILKQVSGHHIAKFARAEVLYLDHRYMSARNLAGLPAPTPPTPGIVPAPRTVAGLGAAPASPNSDLAAFVRWRRRAFDHQMRMLLDPGIKPIAPFSYAASFNPESVRAAPTAEPVAAARPTKRRRRRRR